MIDVIIKTLDSCNHPFSVEDETTVGQLKEKIRDQLNIEIPLQRLLFRGRVLRDETTLAELDVHSKVIHLVQRAPPIAEGRNIRSSGDIGNSTSESSQEMTGAGIGRMGGSNVMTESPTIGRINSITRLIHETRGLLASLRNITNVTKANSEAHPESSSSVLKIPAEQVVQPDPDDVESEEVGNFSRRVQTSDNRRRGSERAARSISLPESFAQVIDDLDQVQLEFAPYRSRYSDLLRGVSAGDVARYTPEQQAKVKQMVDLIGTVYHNISHAYHSISDIDFVVDNNEVSFVSQLHQFPLQIHSNLIHTQSRINPATSTVNRAGDEQRRNDTAHEHNSTGNTSHFTAINTVDIININTPPPSRTSFDDLVLTYSSSDEDITVVSIENKESIIIEISDSDDNSTGAQMSSQSPNVSGMQNAVSGMEAQAGCAPSATAIGGIEMDVEDFCIQTSRGYNSNHDNTMSIGSNDSSKVTVINVHDPDFPMNNTAATVSSAATPTTSSDTSGTVHYNTPIRGVQQIEEAADGVGELPRVSMIAHAFYDRYLNCNNIRSRRVLQRNRNLRLMEAAVAVRERAEREEIQSLETLRKRFGSALTQEQMDLMYTLLRNDPAPETWFNAYLVLLARHIHMNMASISGTEASMNTPVEFHRVRAQLCKYIRNLLCCSGGTPKHAADYLVNQYNDFIEDMKNITPLFPNCDMRRTIYTIIDKYIPILVELINTDGGDSYADRFYKTFTQMYIDVCGGILYNCENGLDGLRLIYKAFLEYVFQYMPGSVRSLFETLAWGNLNGVEDELKSNIRTIDHPATDVSVTIIDGASQSGAQCVITPESSVIIPEPRTDTQAGPHGKKTPRKMRDVASSGSATSSRAQSSSPQSISDDSAINDSQEPMDHQRVRLLGLFRHWDDEWLPVFTRDRERQRQALQAPYSDAYLTGMPSRKRRRVRDAKPPSTLDAFMNESFQEATERTNPVDNSAMRVAFREHVRNIAYARAATSEDYDPKHYACAAMFLGDSSAPKQEQVDPNDEWQDKL